MSTIVPNRVTSSTSSSSSSQIKQEHIKDENDNSSNKNNRDFFDDWNVGNWCWERDYNKYPAVVAALPANNNNNNNCHDGNGIIDRSNDAKMNTTEREQCDDDRKLCDSDQCVNSSNIDERKPAAITYSSVDSGRCSVATTASATIEIATATKKDVREISISKNPQIKVENNDGENTTNDTNDFNNNKYNENNSDDDDDDSFYDDWVEGNWCLLDNSDNSNGEVESKGNNDNSPCKIQHEVTATPSLTRRSRNNNNRSARRKLRRLRYDDNDDSYNEDDVDEEEESDDEDNDDDNKEEEGFIPEDNKGVHNHHQEDKRPVKKRSQRQTHYDNYRDQLWMGMFQKLVEYKKRYKNTTVPSDYKNDPTLGFWVYNQRKRYNNNNLRPYRNDILNSIGFEWDGLKGKAVTDQLIWMNMFQKLVAYKKQHKTTMVPSNYKNDPTFGHWVCAQRRIYKKDELLPNRCALLKSIGFKWYGSKEKNQQLWMGMFQKLVAYKKQHKNTMVPRRYNEDPKLGRWVGKQRHFYNRGELLPARNALLKSIGFTWRLEMGWC